MTGRAEARDGQEAGQIPCSGGKQGQSRPDAGVAAFPAAAGEGGLLATSTCSLTVDGLVSLLLS